jgi:hypothetical protein
VRWDEHPLDELPGRKPQMPKLGRTKVAHPMGQPDPLRVRTRREKIPRHQGRARQRIVRRARPQNRSDRVQKDDLRLDFQPSHQSVKRTHSL